MKRLVLFVKLNGSTDLLTLTRFYNKAKLLYQVVVNGTPEADVLWDTLLKHPFAYRTRSAVAIVDDAGKIKWTTFDLTEVKLQEAVDDLRMAPPAYHSHTDVVQC